jgi:branched-chain amino acid transport system substrate-binding protein
MRRLALAAAAITAALGLIAGCGSSSTSKSAGSTGTSGSTKATGTPIVIGTVGGFSGAQASSQGGVPKALQAWADAVNASGGLGGHPVQLIVKDLGDNLAGGLTAVKELVEQDHVVAIVGEQDNGDASWASYIQSTGVPVVGGLPIDLPFVQNPDFFASGTNEFAIVYGFQMLAKQNGPKLGILYCAESPQCAGAVTLNQGIARATGLQIPVDVKISATAPDYTAVCQQLKDSGAQSYFIGDGSAIVLRVAQQCVQNGLTAKMVAEDGSVTANWASVPSLNGLMVSEDDAPWFDTSTPAMQEFHRVINKYAPNLGDLLGPNTFYSYVAGKLFEKAVAAIPSGTAITRDSIKAGLYTLHNETLGGLAPPLSFTQGQPALVNCYFTFGQSNGKFTEPNGLATSCAPDALVSAIVSSLPKT